MTEGIIKLVGGLFPQITSKGLRLGVASRQLELLKVANEGI